VFLLALAALVHALVLGTRRHRTELATLRAIGFTRGDADGSMIWMAVTLASVALVIGVPLGWIVGRTLWRTLMHQVGLDSAVTSYWVVWVLIPVITLAVAALAAYLPVRRATATPPGETLHTA
ncbi:MAG: FtsX-like permease family protein, partial [Acidimicrobiales bacterium]